MEALPFWPLDAADVAAVRTGHAALLDGLPLPLRHVAAGLLAGRHAPRCWLPSTTSWPPRCSSTTP